MLPTISTFTVFVEVNFTTKQLRTFLNQQNEISINSFAFNEKTGLIHIVINNPDIADVTVNTIAGFAEAVDAHFNTFAELKSCTFA